MSEETKFTPGPWRYRLEAVRTVIFHEAEIGEKAIAVGAGAYPYHIANARLIAAAPELFNGCRALLGLLQLLASRDDISDEVRECLTHGHRIEEALSALAKVTGAA